MGTMKTLYKLRIIFSLGFVLGALFLGAQAQELRISPWVYKYDQSPRLSYEYIGLKRIGYELSFIQRMRNYDPYYPKNDGYWTTSLITFAMKYYGKRKHDEGFYKGVFLTYLYPHNRSSLLTTTDGIFGHPAKIIGHEDKTVSSLIVGGQIGYKFLIAKRFVIEPMVGLGFDYNLALPNKNSWRTGILPITILLGYRFDKY
jgi:hypothetical protein